MTNKVIVIILVIVIIILMSLPLFAYKTFVEGEVEKEVAEISGNNKITSGGIYKNSPNDSIIIVHQNG